MIRIAIDWQPNTISGWGLYGLNLALAFSGDPEVELIFPQGQAWIDPLRAAALNAMSAASKDKPADVFLHALGNELEPEPDTPRDRTIGVIFFEEPLSEKAIEHARSYPLILAGSHWNTRLLQDAGANAVTVHQGVDRTLFHPAPKLMSGRFAVFSGGKAEWRKGQDLVLKAFSIFAQKHDDVVLVTAWHSPWPQLAAAIGCPVRMKGDGTGVLDVCGWARNYGIAEHQIIDLGIVHNPVMPQVYREMACALFPNRAEGGTNLVAMEAMACGVPTLVSFNTGHRDLNGAKFLTQESTDDFGRGETSIDYTVKALERWYTDGELNPWDSELKGFRWSETAAKIKAACFSCLSQTATPDHNARPAGCIPENDNAASATIAAE